MTDVECPSCGREWSQRAKINRGDRLMDSLGLTLFDLANKYEYVCSSKQDSNNDENILGQGEYYLYFHKKPLHGTTEFIK